MWDLIVSVPGRCLSFCFYETHISIKSRQRLKLFKDTYYGTGRSFQKESYH